MLRNGGRGFHQHQHTVRVPHAFSASQWTQISNTENLRLCGNVRIGLLVAKLKYRPYRKRKKFSRTRLYCRLCTDSLERTRSIQLYNLNLDLNIELER